MRDSYFDSYRTGSLATGPETADQPSMEERIADEYGDKIAAEWFVKELKRKSQETFRDRKKLMNNLFEHYLNKPRKRSGPDSPYLNNIPVPVLTESVDAGMAFILPSLFKSYRMCKLIKRTEADAQGAMLMEDKLEYDNMVMGDENEDQEGAFMAYNGMVFSALVLGSGFIRVVPQKIEKQMTMAGASNLPTVTVYEGSNLQVIDPIDIFPHPSKLNIGDRYPIIVRSFHSWEYLKERAAGMEYFDIEDIPAKRHAHPTDTDKFRTERYDMLKISKEDDVHENSIEVLECECSFPISGATDKFGRKIYESAILTTANGQLIGMRKNQDPRGDNFIVHAKGFHIPGMFWGMGICEKGHPQQHLANGLLDSILDNIPYITNRQRLVIRKALESPSQMVSQPGSVWYFKKNYDLNKVFKELKSEPLPSDVYRMLEMAISSAEKASGFTEISKGGGGASVETATESHELSFWASKRGQLYLATIEQTGILPIHRKQVKINLSTVSPEFIEKIWQGRGRVWSDMQRKGGFATQPSVICTAFSVESDLRVAIQQATQLLEVCKGHPVLQELMPFIVKHIIELYNWEDKTEMLETIGYGIRREAAMMEAKMAGEAPQAPVNAAGGQSSNAPMAGTSGAPPGAPAQGPTSQPQKMSDTASTARTDRAINQSINKGKRVGT